MPSAKDLLTAHHQAEQSQRAEQQCLAPEKRRDVRKQLFQPYPQPKQMGTSIGHY